MREFSCLWYFCGQSKTAKNRGTRKTQKSCESERKEPDFKGNRVLFGGDYWTRTSDLLRVKIRQGGKNGLSRPFHPFWLKIICCPLRCLHCLLPAPIPVWVTVWVRQETCQLEIWFIRPTCVIGEMRELTLDIKRKNRNLNDLQKTSLNSKLERLKKIKSCARRKSVP